MSANKAKPHLLVLPEDDANRQIVNGFVKEIPSRQIAVLQPAGGWLEVLETFESEHSAGMDRYPKRLMVLLLDFDEDPERLANARKHIPARLVDRVFVVGAWIEPEKIKPKIGTKEDIGRKIAADCREPQGDVWAHPHLLHNADEVERLRPMIQACL